MKIIEIKGLKSNNKSKLKKLKPNNLKPNNKFKLNN